MIIEALAIALMGLLLVGLGIPMYLEKVPPNRFYGFRTPLTLTNDEVWYAANKLGGKSVTVAGVVMVVLALVGGLLGFLMPPTGLLSLAATGVLLVAVLHAFWGASNYVADREAQAAVESEPDAVESEPDVSRERDAARRAQRATEKER